MSNDVVFGYSKKNELIGIICDILESNFGVIPVQFKDFIQEQKSDVNIVIMDSDSYTPFLEREWIQNNLQNGISLIFLTNNIHDGFNFDFLPRGWKPKEPKIIFRKIASDSIDLYLIDEILKSEVEKNSLEIEARGYLEHDTGTTLAIKKFSGKFQPVILRYTPKKTWGSVIITTAIIEYPYGFTSASDNKILITSLLRYLKELLKGHGKEEKIEEKGSGIKTIERAVETWGKKFIVLMKQFEKFVRENEFLKMEEVGVSVGFEPKEIPVLNMFLSEIGLLLEDGIYYRVSDDKYKEVLNENPFLMSYMRRI